MARVLFDGLVEYEDGKRCILDISTILTGVLLSLQALPLRLPRWPRMLLLSFIGLLNQNTMSAKRLG